MDLKEYTKLGYSLETLERYYEILGEELEEFIKANERDYPKAVRTNLLKISPEDLFERLSEKGFRLRKVSFCNYAFEVLDQPFSIGSTPEFLLGYYYIQDPPTLLPVIELDPKPGELILDLAAAPGGKTTHISMLMKNKGVVFAIDIEKARMRKLRSNLHRMDARNVIAIRMDGREIHNFGILFDKVLLDAPCSSEGLMMRYKNTRRWKYENILDRQRLQKELIKSAINVLKPGGTLIYSTCSLSVEENEMVIKYATENFEVKLRSLDLDIYSKGVRYYRGMDFGKEIEKIGRIWPHKHNMIGFTIAKLKKKG